METELHSFGLGGGNKLVSTIVQLHSGRKMLTVFDSESRLEMPTTNYDALLLLSGQTEIVIYLTPFSGGMDAGCRKAFVTIATAGAKYCVIRVQSLDGCLIRL